MTISLIVHLSIDSSFHAAITCSILTDPSNGVITYTTDTTAPFDYQTTATYSCDAGFRLSIGYTARSCVGSTNGPGIWSGTAPTCEGIHYLHTLADIVVAQFYVCLAWVCGNNYYASVRMRKRGIR